MENQSKTPSPHFEKDCYKIEYNIELVCYAFSFLFSELDFQSGTKFVRLASSGNLFNVGCKFACLFLAYF